LKISIHSSLNKSLRQSIDDFLSVKEEFGAFHSPSFFESLKKDKKNRPFYVIVELEDEIQGVMLVHRQAQINFPGLSFLSSRDVIWSPPIIHKAVYEKVLELLFSAYLCQSLPVYTQARGLDLSGIKDYGFGCEDHLNIMIDLTPSEDQLWKGVHPKRRNEIKKAQKLGVSVKKTDAMADLEFSYRILKEVYRRAQLPLQSFFHFAHLLSNGLLLNFVAEKDQKIIGCLLALHGNGVVYDYYAGSFQSEYANNPNDLIPWEVMLWAKNAGYHTFDFGGAGKPNVPYGVREYKKRFGGAMITTHRSERINFPLVFKFSNFIFQLIRRFL